MAETTAMSLCTSSKVGAMLFRLMWVGVLVVGCSKRNDAVCCLTAADCESIGLTADDVGDRGCRDGESCIDLTCVPTPAGGDATSAADASPDAPISTGRCDTTKDFDTITNLPNVHVAYGERHFVLSSDELTAYVVRDNQDVLEVTTSVRSTKADDFPVDTTDPLLPTAAHALELFPSRQEHLLYFHTRTVPVYRLSQRTTTIDPFVDIGGIGTNDTDAALPDNSNLAGVSPDASRLYYTVGGSLYQLTSNGAFDQFGVPLNVTSMEVDAVALSPDELTLYYATNPATGVFVTTRADKASAFGPGTQIALLATNDQPTSVTADGCVLYIIGAHDSTDGVFAVTKPH